MSVIVERDNIGVFGKMNSGKSSFVNLISQQEASIVDSTPGTTADTKQVNKEIHGTGPVSFYDTAGIDEANELGLKKKKKVIDLLKECDTALLLIDPSAENMQPEKEFLELALLHGKPVLAVYNIFNQKDTARITVIEKEVPLLKNCPGIRIRAVDSACRPAALEFIARHLKSGKDKFPLLPFIKKDEFYVLVIPMDSQSPHGRYLRPQAMTEEYITRNWAYPVSFRLNMNAPDMDEERKRFYEFIGSLSKKPLAAITDSQAAGLMNRWLDEDIMVTTFSIVMINYFSRGRIADFLEGIKTVKELVPGDSVLIAEACNHSRIGEDIGTVQIPEYLKEHFPGVCIEHSFGREFSDPGQLQDYRLVIHCGACMITRQKLQARIKMLEESGVPYTNYGIFLSFIQDPAALKRVMLPWNVNFEYEELKENQRRKKVES